MEASNGTVLRCVALLGMLVLSFAAEIDVKETSQAGVQGPSGAADPVAQGPNPPDFVFTQNKIRLLTCAKKCAISNLLNILNPVKYAAAMSLCMAACKVPEKKPDALYGQQANAEAQSDVPFLCTQNCVSSMGRVMTTNAQLTGSQDKNAAPASPPQFDLHRYAEGYVDACYLSCNKNPKLF